MTIIDCEQGSREWIEHRLGIPTASKFSRLLTPSRLTPSSQQRDYLARLLAEWVTGEPMDDLMDNPWVERGRLLEPEARRHYGVLHDVAPRRVGLCVREADALLVGASPDGLVGDDGLLELKVPAPHTHILWLASGGLPAEHRMQVQGQLWITDRDWCDFMSYHPELPPLLVRVYPDPDVQMALDLHLPDFVAQVVAGRQRLTEMGVESWVARQAEHERVMAEHEHDAAQGHEGAVR